MKMYVVDFKKHERSPEVFNTLEGVMDFLKSQKVPWGHLYNLRKVERDLMSRVSPVNVGWGINNHLAGVSNYARVHIVELNEDETDEN